MQPAAVWVEACKPITSPGIGGEGGDDHQQQHNGPCRVEQLLNRVDESTNRGTKHGSGAAATATITRRKATGAFNQRDICQATIRPFERQVLPAQEKAAADGDDAGDQRRLPEGPSALIGASEIP